MQTPRTALLTAQTHSASISRSQRSNQRRNRKVPELLSGTVRDPQLTRPKDQGRVEHWADTITFSTLVN